jgi:hypothetical protein
MVQGVVSGLTMDEAMPSTKALMELYQWIKELEAKLAVKRNLIKECKAKIEKLELDNLENKKEIKMCSSTK